MEYTEILTRYTANFVDELTKNGIHDVVISPGSRSTPLALTFTEHPDINEWILVDERSAAFFALGIAKEKGIPVALVCTSGTAAANYYPAIVEAHYSRVPLIVLTADRPHELRGIGAPQAIEQLNLYGEYVKSFQEMALPEASPEMLQYVRNHARRAVHTANAGNQGVVHLNFPFREPLTPDFSIENLWEPVGNTVNEHADMYGYDGIKQLSANHLQVLAKKLQNREKGVIVCGPQMDFNLHEVVTELAQEWQIPIIADPLSQVRSGQGSLDVVIEGYDAFLRNKTIRNLLKPDFIIRFGAMPVSKAFLFYMKENKDVHQIVVENDNGYREPTGNKAEFIFADPVNLCVDLQGYVTVNSDPSWLSKWQKINEVAKKHLNQVDRDESVTEGGAIKSLLEVTPENSYVFAANSMPIRDVDSFMMSTNKNVAIFANRGANGIDGLISTGMGVATSGKPITIVAGDLSFYHDMKDRKSVV